MRSSHVVHGQRHLEGAQSARTPGFPHNDYGKRIRQQRPLSYNKYLRVPDLIGLQNCLSDPAHHDELLFITVHQPMSFGSNKFFMRSA